MDRNQSSLLYSDPGMQLSDFFYESILKTMRSKCGFNYKFAIDLNCTHEFNLNILFRKNKNLSIRQQLFIPKFIFRPNTEKKL